MIDQMTKNSFRFVHVDQDFALSGTDIPDATPAYTHAAVMRALMRIRAVCSEEVLAEIPGLDRELSAMVLTQHELYSRLVLLNPEDIEDENSLEQQLIRLRQQHLPPNIAGTTPSQRIFPRYRTKINLMFLKNDKEIVATSTNVSLDGLCADFDLPAQLNAGDKMTVKLLGKTRQISMEAHIAWSFDNHKGSVAGVALKFLHADDLINWLKFILALHLKANPQQKLENVQ